MSIESSLLNRLKNNDPTLIDLTLSHKGLIDQDIQALVEALATNNTLTTLDVSANQIGDEGAKTLATHKTLTALNVSDNNIGPEGAKALAANTTLIVLNIGASQTGWDEGAKTLEANTSLLGFGVTSDSPISTEAANTLMANTSLLVFGVSDSKPISAEAANTLANNTSLIALGVGGNQIGNEGAKALAANTTLTALNVSGNQIGDEGAKAFATNNTLTALNVSGNPMSYPWQKVLEQKIAHNLQAVSKRRDQFIQAMLILARDSANPSSHSAWSVLPRNIQRPILSFLALSLAASLGKTPKQVQECINFIFNNLDQLQAALPVALSTKQGLKVMEKRVKGISQFRFFPAAKPAENKKSAQPAVTEQNNEAVKVANKA